MKSSVLGTGLIEGTILLNGDAPLSYRPRPSFLQSLINIIDHVIFLSLPLRPFHSVESAVHRICLLLTVFLFLDTVTRAIERANIL